MSLMTTQHKPYLKGLWLVDREGITVHAEGCLLERTWQDTLVPQVRTWRDTGQVVQLGALPRHAGTVALCAEIGEQLLILVRPTEQAHALYDFMVNVPFAPSVLDYFLTSVHDAITVIDAQGTLRYISPPHEKWLGLRPGQALGRPAHEIIPNSRMVEVAKTGRAEIGHPYTADGVATRIVSRIPIREEGQVVGVIGRTLFKGPEAVQRIYQEVSKLQAEVAKYRRHLGQLQQQHEALAPLIGHSAPMRALRQELETVAHLDIPVLITGESGTGKELVAKALHALSPRQQKALVSMNLAALPTSLLESELFGYAPGSFTGSQRSGRMGKFELADKSTFFLDEVGDIPAEIQVKLLRVLEDHVVERLGENKERKVDFRLVSATHQKMDEMVQTGRFRLDLYYRIAGVTLCVPSLSERLEDIPELLDHFVRLFCTRNHWPVPAITSEVPTYLAQQPWPGNVRQLRQKVEEALVFSAGKPLEVVHFQRRGSQARALTTHPLQETPAPTNVIRPLSDIERQAAQDALRLSEGNKKKAAHALGISRSHLYKLLGS